MRILTISASYAPDSGGVARHVSTLAAGLVRLFDDIFINVLTLRRPGMDFKKDMKGRLVEWKLDRRTVPEFNGRRVMLSRFITFAFENWREFNPSLIHVHDFDSLYVGLLLRTAFQVPLVMTVHRAPTEWFDGRCREDEKDCFMEAARLHKFVDRMVVPSIASQNILKQQGFRNLKVIPHGVSQHLVSCKDDSTVLSSLNLPTDAHLIFCPGRADEHKDLPLFIQGAGILRRNLKKPAAFLLTSETEKEDSSQSPEYTRALHAIAREYGLVEGKDIFFTTPFPYGSALASVYRRSRVVVIPSLHESFGQNVLDAFMFRKPVVARARTGLKEIVQHEKNGLLFESPKKMAWQVWRALNDHELVTKITDTAKSRMGEQFSVGRMAQEYRRLYESVLSGNSE